MHYEFLPGFAGFCGRKRFVYIGFVSKYRNKTDLYSDLLKMLILDLQI